MLLGAPQIRRTRVRRWAPAVFMYVAGTAGLAVSASAQAPELGTVRGSVVEAGTETPVRSAAVVLVPLSSPPATRDSLVARPTAVYTNQHGEYAFQGVPPGQYRIDVSGLGYRSTRIWIDLPRPWKLRRSVALEVEPVRIEAVKITLKPVKPHVSPDLVPLGTRGLPIPRGLSAADSPMLYGLDMRVLDPANLPQSGPLGEPDVFRALERFPGVSAKGDFSADLWTRGSPWGMTQVLLDGLPLYDPIHLGGIVAGLAADALESVALMPGVRPPSVDEGAAGTIVLTTRPAAKRAASLGVSSLAVRSRVEDRLFDDRVGVAITARRSWWDLVSPPAILASPESRGPIDYHFTDLSGRFDVDLGSVGTLEGGGLWEGDHLHGDISGVVSTSEGRWGNRLDWLKLSRSLGRLRAETRLGRVAYRVSTRPLPWYAFVRRNGVPTLDQTRTSIDHTSLETSVRGSFVSGHLTWGAGLDLVHERLTQFGADATDRGLPGVQAPALLSRTRGWTEGTVRFRDVDVAGGVSVQGSDGDVPSPAVLPSVRIRWSPTSWLALEGAKGKSIQFIYPLAPAGVSLGPDLGVGYTWIIAGQGRPALVARTSTAAAELSFTGGTFAQLVWWWRAADGLWLPGVSILCGGGSCIEPAALNGDELGGERGSGFEARIGWRNRRLDAEAGYSTGRSRFREGSQPSWPSPAERRHSLDLHVQGHVTNTVDMAADYTSESGWPFVQGPYTPSCGSDAPATCVDRSDTDPIYTRYSFTDAPRYESLDLSARWTHLWSRVRLDLAASVNNLLGHPNEEAFRAGTCEGAELVSNVCERSLGVARFSPGLTRPTPAFTAKVRF